MKSFAEQDCLLLETLVHDWAGKFEGITDSGDVTFYPQCSDSFEHRGYSALREDVPSQSYRRVIEESMFGSKNGQSVISRGLCSLTQE